MAVGESILVARKVSKIYRTPKVRFQALSRVDLTVQEGEFLAIVGASGSGKTTLLSLLAGLDAPTQGSIVVQGRSLHHMNQTQLARYRLHHIGFVFQTFQLLSALTALENVALPLMVQGVGKRERWDRAQALLEAFGLQDHLFHRPDALSGGQAQRTAIARALVGRPELLFADEPTGNLDSETADEIMGYFVRIAQQGTTVLMVTHDRARAQYADRIIELEDGRIREEHP